MESKKWYLSKGVWLGVVVCLGGIAELLLNLSPEASYTTMVVGILQIVIRAITNQPISR